MKEKVAGGFRAQQQRTLLHIRTEESDHGDRSEAAAPDVGVERVFFVTDPAASLCHPALSAARGSAEKPLCEMNPFQQQPSHLSWAAPLTASGLSPPYLQADWSALTVKGVERRLSVSTVMRAPAGTQEPRVVLSVSTRTVLVRARLGESVVLDCSLWADPSSPLSGSGFAVEWRYQFRGRGRLVLAYDGKLDRLADPRDQDATMDFEALHATGNASLILQGAKVQHSGMYICTTYLPYLQTQVAMELEIVEPPSLSIHPSPLPLLAPGQSLSVQCEASGFAPLTLDLSWEVKGRDGRSRPLASSSVTGHKQAWDGTYSQSVWLELDTSQEELGPGGELTCVAVHPGGTRRSSTPLSIMAVTAPSLEDSMAMVGVALLLYGLIKVVSWSVGGSGTAAAGDQEKKKN